MKYAGSFNIHSEYQQYIQTSSSFNLLERDRQLKDMNTVRVAYNDDEGALLAHDCVAPLSPKSVNAKIGDENEKLSFRSTKF